MTKTKTAAGRFLDAALDEIRTNDLAKTDRAWMRLVAVAGSEEAAERALETVRAERAAGR